MITIIQKYTWTFGQNNCGCGGQIGQVTRCRTDGIEFWVRENITGIDSFLISSAERHGEKEGLGKVRASRQVLDLLCHPLYWDHVAELVHDHDPLHRPVIHNARFNKAFVKEIMSTQ